MANKFKIVVGANFGDEGKGHITNYLCSNEIKIENRSCLVVLSNGGAQRGHTVLLPDGKRHVFKHFGSGTLVGASTYLPKDYILNPMIFRQELRQFFNLEDNIRIYYHPDCYWTTPFDMILNQLVENHRGKDRHGSCGLGIWETIVRSTTFNHKSIKDINYSELIEYLLDIRNKYLPSKIEEYEISRKELSDWNDIIYNDNLIINYIDDLLFMKCCMEYSNDQQVIDSFDTVIFENGQGLLLDQNIKGYGNNTTPSNTGIKNPLDTISSLYIDDNNLDIEVIYVSRSYMTRHGAGRFDTECLVSELTDGIDDKIHDHTNTYNPYQGELRYGKLNIYDLIDRIKKDYYSHSILPNKLSLAITHLDQLDVDLNIIKTYFNDKLYLSTGPKSTDIKEFFIL